VNWFTPGDYIMLWHRALIARPFVIIIRRVMFPAICRDGQIQQCD
jgi:hypothetical protein